VGKEREREKKGKKKDGRKEAVATWGKGCSRALKEDR